MSLDYEAEYARLNEAQRQAVDLIDGPLLVIAGPGTGKTQLLSLRVANILRSTDTDPSSILCLTFTNLAAVNMRERLTKLVGKGAHNVNVRTFHSFAAELMQLYPEYYWNGARLSVVPDTVQLEIIQSLLSELPLDNPLALKFAGNFTSIADVQTALKLTKEAGLTPGKLKAMVEINEAYIDHVEKAIAETLNDRLNFKKLEKLNEQIQGLPDQSIDETVAPLKSLSSVIKDSFNSAVEADLATGKCTETGKWKKKWIQVVNGVPGLHDERRRNKWWLALSEAYETYRRTLHERGYYDYSDMIVEVISGLEQNPELLASAQERFSYVLIDEFQDANNAQLRLAHLVASHHTNEGKPNLMAVGDDDQTIFAFNGAELKNMLTFEKQYPSAKTVVLTDNYRSTQSVLNAAEKIISQADDRLVHRLPELTKKLKAVTDQPDGDIEHIKYPSREHQLSDIAKRIKQTWEQDTSQSLAVLARNHNSLKRVSAFLQNEGVPVRYEQQNNILDHQLIQQVFTLAELVNSISSGEIKQANYYISTLLAYPAWKVEPVTLWKLATENSGKDASWLDYLLKSKDENLARIAGWLTWLATEAVKEPVPVIIEHMVGLRAGEYMTSPLKEYYLSLKSIDSGYLESLSGLSVLQNLVFEFAATSAHGTPKLKDFLRFMRVNKELGRQIVDESWFVSSEKAVQLLTIHKAKGLEFDSVYLLDAIENDWQPRHFGRKPPANLPLQPYGEHFDDYVRLAYVAATRSRRSFIVSSYACDEKGQKLLSTPIFDTMNLTELDYEDEAREDKIEILESSLHWPRLSSDNERALIQPKLDNYRLNATGLLQFLDVTNGGPSQFLERQLLKLPSITTDRMSFGIAMHAALQTAQNLINKDSFDLGLVKDAYKNSLESQQKPVSTVERYLPHGISLIEKLFKDYELELPKGGQAEVVINNNDLDGVPISGTLDSVFLDGDTLVISDYKTGKALNSFATRDQNKAVKAWRHHSQLLFYCLLAECSGRFKTAKKYKARMIYIESEDPDKLYLEIEPGREELEHVRQLILAAWEKISSYNLPDTDEYPEGIEGIRKFEEDLIKGK